MTATTWTPQEHLHLEDWAKQGQRLGVLGRCAGWWIGDWLNYGNHRFGERYVRAARITGYDVQTLMNMAYVASHIEPSRRRETLSWSHHAEVVALPPEAQDRLLDRAAIERLSVRCLREEIRRERRAERASADEIGEAAATEPDAAHRLVCPSCGHDFEKAAVAV